MKTLRKPLILLFIAVFSLSAFANNDKPENSILWEISGNGLNQSSYLFGTIHMICEKDFSIKPKVDRAFDKTSKLVLEINLNDNAEMEALQKLAFGKVPLSEKLSPEQNEELTKILQQKIGMPLKQFDKFTLQTLLSLLFIKSFGCTNIKSYELEFIAKANESKKPILGFEKVNDQMKILENAYSDDELISYFKLINSDYSNEMVKIYSNEDIEALYRMMADKQAMSDKAKILLLDNRNKNWMKEMPNMMKSESLFFAIGAAHLVGESGLINLLRKAGYIVKPIIN
ncbi:MAG: TraB/GumN family protein [Bacteroidales bacterium]|nr:TraB/GumN family protein [Bacteroidales bacterium]